VTTEQLSPFGLAIHAEPGSRSLTDIATADLKNKVEEHRVVVLRGFAPLTGTAFPEYCEKFGEILEWEFGSVNHLRADKDARNYLYTNHHVPFHWDGAFLSQAPHYIFFHCDLAPPPGSGGETLFCDTTLVLANASTEHKELWKTIDITYKTEKVVHYGGTFTSPMVVKHPFNKSVTLRYAEPVSDINPVELVVHNLPAAEQAKFIQDMNDRLTDGRHCYSHRWENGDVVIADNFTLLHGRRAFEQGATREIRRVNIL
jgi:alpha-ketoglutarate-dependent taurine dioxygenase